VTIVDGKAVNGSGGKLVFVEGPVSSGLMTGEAATKKFSLDEDGHTIWYHPTGAPPGVNRVDVTKLGAGASKPIKVGSKAKKK
jgi:hypothetical protein